ESQDPSLETLFFILDRIILRSYTEEISLFIDEILLKIMIKIHVYNQSNSFIKKHPLSCLKNIQFHVFVHL
ncbi:hypothetical protein, partial [Paraburkholderia sp. SIMBA_053]|uniref:hypothetical protein n=1 Tax=Paraburkholderia sp. SIMBA_053 TaxID=3085794 RepID=UPI0039790F38